MYPFLFNNNISIYNNIRIYYTFNSPTTSGSSSAIIATEFKLELEFGIEAPVSQWEK